LATSKAKEEYSLEKIPLGKKKDLAKFEKKIWGNFFFHIMTEILVLG
jgi:hypothetical protein